MGPARRVKAKGVASEPKLLYCPACEKAFPVFKHIQDTISKLGGPVERTDIDKLIFKGEFSSVPEVNSMQKVAIANFSNGHDPLHRPTCLKSKKAQKEKKCRSSMPAKPEPSTYIRLLYANCGCDGEVDAEADRKTIEENEAELKSILDPENSHEDLVEDSNLDEESKQTDPSKAVCQFCQQKKKVVSMEIRLERSNCSVWFTSHCPLIQDCFSCNNNIQYIRNHTISLYDGCYITKSTKENAESLAGASAGMTRSFRRELEVEEEEKKAAIDAAADDIEEVPVVLGDSDTRKAQRRLNATVRGHTSSELIGSPMAALL
jgi:hypothetical protein